MIMFYMPSAPSFTISHSHLTIFRHVQISKRFSQSLQDPECINFILVSEEMRFFSAFYFEIFIFLTPWTRFVFIFIAPMRF